MSRLKAAVIAGVALASTSMAASANTITFEGLNFSLTALTSTELEIQISAATGNSITASAASAGPDWAGISSLAALAVKPAGGTYTGATLAGWNFESTGLNANGCGGGSNGSVCFDRPSPLAIPATGSIVLDIFFTGGTVTFGAPSLKVEFLDANGNKKGSLFSQDVTASLPAPGPLVGAGLPGGLALAAGLLGWLRRKRTPRAA